MSNQQIPQFPILDFVKPIGSGDVEEVHEIRFPSDHQKPVLSVFERAASAGEEFPKCFLVNHQTDSGKTLLALAVSVFCAKERPEEFQFCVYICKNKAMVKQVETEAALLLQHFPEGNFTVEEPRQREKFFQVMTYESFRSIFLKDPGSLTNSALREMFKRCILVFDEVQNATDFEEATKLSKALREASGFFPSSLLLSATPQTNGPFDLVFLLRLLHPEWIQEQETNRGRLLFREFVIHSGESAETTTVRLSQVAKEMEDGKLPEDFLRVLAEGFKDRISVRVPSDPESDSDGRGNGCNSSLPQDVKVIRVPMDPFTDHLYAELQEKLLTQQMQELLHSVRARDLLTGDSEGGEAPVPSDDSLQNHPEVRGSLTKDEAKRMNCFLSLARQLCTSHTIRDDGKRDKGELRARYAELAAAWPNQSETRWSGKIEALCRRFLELFVSEDRKGIIYSTYNAAGLDPIKNCMDALAQEVLPAGKRLNIRVINYTADAELRTRIVKDFNDGNVHLILLCSAGGEGIDLHNVEQVHILEPHWNNQRLVQVFGRAREQRDDAARQERGVKKFLYISERRAGTGTGTGVRTPTADEHVYATAQKKDQLIKQAAAVLKRVCIEAKGSVDEAVEEAKKVQREQGVGGQGRKRGAEDEGGAASSGGSSRLVVPRVEEPQGEAAEAEGHGENQGDVQMFSADEAAQMHGHAAPAEAV
uniref:Helicase C-terminal domain-containing protein n=1 Tax=Chromera velia CCMP2878 TaxID=1169474 RepID=A0A0G4G328_9ALVE|eukprot:Cvel_4107.t1-p1 / transcript=Cvel_4107.t1 / gene=Cvel_4107 / organism=Chromera_velia_CCMP2878 / gene_product=Putative ATP-dependent RNA helicase L538, putative / transcript_product=Putative ATP-dependent RNA helicase L538, putative / location=Cvel_scaffold175:31834-34208(-) / protein_length=704 / sequence_SO=supercontig / SO=protein_coding / is_pseudo=false